MTDSELANLIQPLISHANECEGFKGWDFVSRIGEWGFRHECRCCKKAITLPDEVGCVNHTFVMDIFNNYDSMRGVRWSEEEIRRIGFLKGLILGGNGKMVEETKKIDVVKTDDVTEIEVKYGGVLKTVEI